MRVIALVPARNGSKGVAGLTPFKELALKLFRKRHYILNFFIRRIISEGINNNKTSG